MRHLRVYGIVALMQDEVVLDLEDLCSKLAGVFKGVLILIFGFAPLRKP